jgi:hypothetical protein
MPESGQDAWANRALVDQTPVDTLNTDGGAIAPEAASRVPKNGNLDDESHDAELGSESATIKQPSGGVIRRLLGWLSGT